MPKTKKKRTAKRRVEFTSQPEIYEITPLTDKPLGVKRLPPECRPRDHTEQDLESPENGVLQSSNGQEQLQNEVEIVDDSTNSLSDITLSVTKPPPKKEGLSRRAKVFGMPKFDLSEGNGTEQPSQNLKVAQRKSMEDDSLLNPSELNAIKSGALVRAKATSQLWSSLFCPQNKEAIFATDAYSKLNSWLLLWMERLQKRQRIEGENGRKGKKRRTDGGDDDEDDDDECYEESSEEPPDNPAILSGPTGCGKTAMVYCAAKNNAFQVLEIPPYEKRDKQFLEQKLSGASDTYNMKVGGKTPDIRDLFNPKRNSPTALKRKISIGFTLILIDECDIQYSADTHFWSTLKQICANSLVPIVLTCNDYEIVRRNMLNREPTLDTYFSICVDEFPSFQSFYSYLRRWLIGFTGKGKLNDPTRLRTLFNQKHGDFRAILNALQFDRHFLLAIDERTNDDQKQLDFKQCVLQAKLVASVDSICGKTNAISWRAKQMADLDYRRERLSGDWTTNVVEMDAIRTELLSLLHVDGAPQMVKPNSAVSCAALHRSYPDMIYATRETSMDYLPCLQMIDKFASCSGRRPLHPFETVDTEMGRKIDESHKLQYFLEDYCLISSS